MANRFDKIFSEKLSAVIAITSLICLLVSIYIFIIHGSWQFSPILDEAKVAQFGDFVGGVVGCNTMRTTNYHTLPSFRNVSVLARLLVT